MKNKHEAYLQTSALAVGYNKKAIIHDIELTVEKGKIVTLIGPNGSGKSTILKSITRQLATIGGSVYIDKNELSAWDARRMAKKVALVLTDRIRPELMSCAEVVALGRYPYTNMLGRLGAEDKRIVREALERVNALELADRDFSALSDGQKQRIILARAICQQPELIVLDEPTAYLDIKHKIELLGILREMAHDNGITVIMSLHEIDLASKVSDLIVCVKGETIAAFGAPETILVDNYIDKLYDINKGSYNALFGSVELEMQRGKPRAFIVCGGGKGAEIFRALQKRGIPFAAGILFENDVDAGVALALSENVVLAEAFEPIGEKEFDKAAELIKLCGLVIDAGTKIGSLNEANARLIEFANKNGISVVKGADEL